MYNILNRIKYKKKKKKKKGGGGLGVIVFWS